MADREQLRILREEGVESWNEWRKNNPYRNINLTGANLSLANLSLAKLSEANLSRAKLIGANLSGANLFKANLFKANLSEANLFKANLSEASLTGANLSEASLTRVNLTGVNLTGTNLSETNLSKANLPGADLSRANLLGTNLSRANLSRVNLLGTNLSRANLSRANLLGTNLLGTNLSRANLSRANLSGANLSRANLSRANLSRANLSRANLSRANLSEFDISGVDLTGANLSGANLSRTNLSEFDLSGANLSRTNLSVVQALGTNFSSATFTGACIKDWNINSQTNFEGVICDYIYLKANKQERRPSDPNRNFAPGDFAKLIEQSRETVDLIFNEGIDWQLFLTAFQELQIESGSDELSIQAIEKKRDGAFVIRVDAPLDANKDIIEASFWNKYQPLLDAKDKEIKLLSQQTEFYSEQIEFIRQDNTRLLGIVETMAEKETSKYDLRGANIGNLADQVRDNARQQANQYNYAPEQKQTLAEAAEEIQKLLQQLEQSNPSATETEKIEHINDETTPKFKRRVVAALKAAGDTAIEEFLQRPYVKVVASGVKAWMLPD